MRDEAVMLLIESFEVRFTVLLFSVPLVSIKVSQVLLLEIFGSEISV